MTDQSLVLQEILQLAARYGARQVQPRSRVYADLHINGSDFIDFVEEVERRYDVDLSWVSPRDRRIEARDPTIEALAEDVLRQRG